MVARKTHPPPRPRRKVLVAGVVAFVAAPGTLTLTGSALAAGYQHGSGVWTDLQTIAVTAGGVVAALAVALLLLAVAGLLTARYISKSP